MKRTPYIISALILTCTVITALGSEGGEKIAENFLMDTSLTDTLTEKSWIKVDHFDLDIVLPSYGLTFYKDGIVYLSSSKYEKSMPGSHISFGKAEAKHAILNDTVMSRPNLFSNSSSFTYPTDALTFSSDYRTMYFTKFSEKEGLEKIYRADYSDAHGDWNFEDSPLSFCSGYSRYSHPSLSADGKMMVFASDKPGSLGGMDLYAVSYTHLTLPTN